MSDPFEGSDLTVTHSWNGEKFVTDYFNSQGFFVGATYENPDGSGTWFTTDGNHGSWSSNTYYWAFGGSLGLGFEVWGNSAGDAGLAWTSGLGFIAEFGDAATAPAALAETYQSGTTLSSDVDPLPSYIHFNPDGTVTFDTIGVNFGLYWTDQDSYYDGSGRNTTPRTPDDGGTTQIN